MLKSLVKGTVGKWFVQGSRQRRKEELLASIQLAHDAREWRKAIALGREYLELDPRNVRVMVNLGLHLLEVGELPQAYESFNLAHLLDDSDLYVAVNYARCLLEGGRVPEAIENLTRAQVAIPGYPYISAHYAALQFKLGNVPSAVHFSLGAWLADFDNNRVPDAYMWHSAYADRAEPILTAEHHFWANTLLPLTEKMKAEPVEKTMQAQREKIRIGYWSPDFREHSVRYFFRPLLEGHDRERVEIFLYHDASSSDSQTEEVRARADQFHAVYEKSDEELVQFIKSHDLDVLVELAGHTSHNRLWLMQGRMARVQVTGLGYPPTTGLETVDVKLLDPHLSTPDDALFYTERPLVLPHSFWCFDPRGDAPEPADAPVLAAGYVTFGCFGNIAKINRPMLDCWAEILRRVPRSRLLVRAVNFTDATVVATFKKQLVEAGIPENRFSLLPPVISVEFFKSYEEVDIVLDTFPFNGGTTTCFATYMGVPVITLKGSSLISRMGASVVANAGAPELAASTIEEYKRKAIALSQDVAFLKQYRRQARVRMGEGALGDGRKFANDFEDACEELLREKKSDKPYAGCNGVVPLPPQELVRRAATVLGHGQWSGAKRILDYCLAHYPDFAGAHILATEELTREQKFAEAATYLENRLAAFAAVDIPAVLINIVRYQILASDRTTALKTLDRLRSTSGGDAQEQMQAALFDAVLRESKTHHAAAATVPAQALPRITCVIPCDLETVYQSLVGRLQCLEGAESVRFVRSREGLRIDEYRKALAAPDTDIVVLLQKNIQIHNPAFFLEIARTLETADVVGFSGSRRWDRLDWRLDEFSRRTCGYTTPCGERPDFSEIRIAGAGTARIDKSIAVLEGYLLAVRPRKVRSIEFDSDLLEAESLLEEAWSHAAGKAGARLAVHRGLGVFLDTSVDMPRDYLVAARLSVVQNMKFDVFSTVRNDGSFLQAPCADAGEGFSAIDRYLDPVQGRPDRARV